MIKEYDFKIGLDVDGVLANFYSSICKRFNRPIEPIKTWNQNWINNSFNKLIHDDEFWENLDILNSSEAIPFKFDAYITSIPNQQHRSRCKWLKLHNYPNNMVVSTSDKLLAMIDLGINVLVDDKWENVEKVRLDGRKAIYYCPFYFTEELVNLSKGIDTARSMTEVELILDKYEQEGI